MVAMDEHEVMAAAAGGGKKSMLLVARYGYGMVGS